MTTCSRLLKATLYSLVHTPNSAICQWRERCDRCPWQWATLDHDIGLCGKRVHKTMIKRMIGKQNDIHVVKMVTTYLQNYIWISCEELSIRRLRYRNGSKIFNAPNLHPTNFCQGLQKFSPKKNKNKSIWQCKPHAATSSTPTKYFMFFLLVIWLETMTAEYFMVIWMLCEQ